MADAVDTLVAALRGELDAEQVAHWPELMALAARHGVEGVLLHGLGRVAAPLMPAETREEWQHRRLGILSANFRLYAVLRELLAAFAEAGVDVIVLKGAFLADQVYAEMGMRSMGDIDLLARPDQVDDAEAVLSALGFRDPDERDPESRRGFCESHAHLPPLERKGEGVRVELHWSFEAPADPLQMDMAAVWHRARRCAYQDGEAFALHPADLLLHLCMHASYHHGFSMGLRTLCDLDACVRRWGAVGEWLEVDRIAGETGVSAAVYALLWCARDVIGTAVPDSLLASLSTPCPSLGPEALATIRDRLLGMSVDDPVFGITMPPEIPGSRATAVRAAARFESIRRPDEGRLRALGRILFPAPERMRRMHGVEIACSRLVLLYALRPFSLAARWGRGMWGALAGTSTAARVAQRESNARVLEAWLDTEISRDRPRP